MTDGRLAQLLSWNPRVDRHRSGVARRIGTREGGMTEIEEKIIARLRRKRRSMPIQIGAGVLWMILLACWFSAVDPDKTLRGELWTAMFVVLAIFLFARRVILRDTQSAEQALRSGAARAWFQTYLDKLIRDARWTVWLCPVGAPILAWTQWELHSPGTERAYVTGLGVLLAISVAATWWAARELRQLRRERARI
jgi:hypothetical protein